MASKKHTSEKAIESHLVNQVKKFGGWAIKLWPISVTGLPDRLVLMPGGQVYFVELKTLIGQLSARQILVAKKLRKLGFRVEVLNSKETINLFINEIQKGN